MAEELTQMTHGFTQRGALVGAVLLGLTAGGAAAAQTRPDVPEVTEVTTDLGQNASAVTYWIKQADAWHVVTTVDAGTAEAAQERHAVVRFTVNLLPGQAQLVSVPGPLGADTPSLRIQRVGDHIEVARVPNAS
jgi:hypothetical protein